MRPLEATLAILPNFPVEGLNMFDPHRVEDAKRLMSDACLDGAAEVGAAGAAGAAVAPLLPPPPAVAARVMLAAEVEAPN